MSFFGLGPNEVYLYIHGLLFILIAGFACYLFGGIYFTKTPDKTFMFRLRYSALITFFLVLGMTITGLLPDMSGFGSGAFLTSSWQTTYGNFTQSITDTSLGNFTGPYIFDMMEHISFVGLAMVGVVTYLIWDFGELVVTEARVKWSILAIMFVTVAWLIILGVVGTILTKSLTFPPGV